MSIRNRKQENMEKKRFSTGTKGRIKQHAEECKEAIQLRCNNESLALEFIAEIDPNREDKVWQMFQTKLECLNKLEAWLGVEAKPVQPPTKKEDIVKNLSAQLGAKREPTIKQSDVVLAIASCRDWVESKEGAAELVEIGSKSSNPQSAQDIAKYIIGRLEITLLG